MVEERSNENFMKITHICLCGAVTDGMTYQDNLLPKYHKKLGNDVSIITSNWIYDSDGRIVTTDAKDYINEYGIRIIRINCSNSNNYNYKFKRFNGIMEALNQTKPEFLFIHGVQFVDLIKICKYIQQNNIVAVADNHADYSNSGRGFLSKYILHGIYWKKIAQKCDKYISHYYGVLPARVEFLQERYKLPKDKISYLPMGADNEEISRVLNTDNSYKIKKMLGIQEDEIVIVTGGKIDKAKTQILYLMRAVQCLQKYKLRLLVFGSVEDDLKEEFNKLLNSDIVLYLGWATSEQSYDYFSIADLVVFPGRHSVYWEQVAGMGIPMICKYWHGTTHVDHAGNCLFINDDSVRGWQDVLREICENHDMLSDMKKAAMSTSRSQFQYEQIALKSLEYSLVH